jgi:hypothetical protein
VEILCTSQTTCDKDRCQELLDDNLNRVLVIVIRVDSVKGKGYMTFKDRHLHLSSLYNIMTITKHTYSIVLGAHTNIEFDKNFNPKKCCRKSVRQCEVKKKGCR